MPSPSCRTPILLPARRFRLHRPSRTNRPPRENAGNPIQTQPSSLRFAATRPTLLTPELLSALSHQLGNEFIPSGLVVERALLVAPQAKSHGGNWNRSTKPPPARHDNPDLWRRAGHR